MRLWALKYILVAVGFCSSPALAETLDEVAGRFAARQAVLDVSLSPSGDQIAYIAPGGSSVEVLYVVDLNGDPSPKGIMKMSDKDADLNYCNWANDERLVCHAFMARSEAGLLLGYTRQFAIRNDGSEIQLLTERTSARALGVAQSGGSVLALDVADENDKILMSKVWVEDVSIATRLANDRNGLGVDLVDITNGKRTVVEQPDENAVWYVADEQGRIRLKVTQAMEATGRVASSRLYYYRTANSDQWLPLSRAEFDSQTFVGFRPVAVDSQKNVAYGFQGLGGYDALVSIKLDGSGDKQVIMSRDDVDVDGLIRIGRQRRVVGASYATEKRRVAYFDPELENLASQLASALPGNPAISIVDASADESRLLIIASSDKNPGTIYLFDKSSGQLQELLPVRDYMAGQQMAEMRPINYEASDGTTIPGYLTLPVGSSGKDLPAVVMPHGGPGSRDEWGFDWLAQFFAARGYAVLQPNFRGSAGYGRAWFGKNGFQAWNVAIGDVNDAGRWLVKEGVANPKKLAIVGWSYGGYAALQSQVVDPALYKAVVAIAPVTDLEQLREDARDYVNYSLVDSFIGRGDHVKAGSPAQNVGRFSSPVLMFHGDMDQNVDVIHSRLMRDKLRSAGKTVEYMEFEDLRHSLHDGPARFEMLKKIDGFLNSSLNK